MVRGPVLTTEPHQPRHSCLGVWSTLTTLQPCQLFPDQESQLLQVSRAEILRGPQRTVKILGYKELRLTIVGQEPRGVNCLVSIPHCIHLSYHMGSKISEMGIHPKKSGESNPFKKLHRPKQGQLRSSDLCKIGGLIVRAHQ